MRRVFYILVLLLGVLPVALAQTGTWSGEIEFRGMTIGMVFHFDGDEPTMDVPDQGAFGLPMQVERKDAESVVVNIPAIGASFKGSLQDRKIVGTFLQMGLSLPMTLTPGLKKLNRPQTPVPPFPYDQEEVSFNNGDACLKGTLTLPKNCSSNTIALIMASGSGLQDRNEEIFEHKPFAVIADALARAGIATLRFDDRGFGESTGDVQNATIADFKDDALAGIQLLRKRFNKVGILGHSEGGSIALMLAADKQVDFAVSLAGMVVSGAETLIWQTELALAATGVPENHVKEYRRLLIDTYSAILSGGTMPSLDGYELTDMLKQSYSMLGSQIQSPYIKYLIALDIRPQLSKITCPILALNGTKDQQVKCEDNLGALKEGLKSSDAAIEAMEGLNHLFQHSETGQPAEYRRLEETFAPEAIEKIIKWISALK